MKTISDNEIIETSRGKKRIGALFDENAMLHAEIESLRIVNNGLLEAMQKIAYGGPMVAKNIHDLQLIARDSLAVYFLKNETKNDRS